MLVNSNPVKFNLEPENYTLVSTETLENAFPVTAGNETVEASVTMTPSRSPKETRKLGRTLFFKRK